MRYRSSFLFLQNPESRTRGFGLIELMVSISIMTLVTTVILVKNRSFNNALLLRNQAYEIAFSLRQVQLLAVSSNIKETGTRKSQFGMYITTGTSTYRLFRDNGSNRNRFDTTDTLASPIETLDSRYQIQDIVNSTGASLGLAELSVIFVRPNFDALFYDSAAMQINGPVYLKITPKDISNYDILPVRLVEITGTGQINVK